MPSDSLPRFPAAAPDQTLPPAILAFLRLCFVAALFNDFVIVAAAILHPHHMALQSPVENEFGLHVFGALIAGVILFPFFALPYWLALAFVYARNEWARGFLYLGAACFLLGTMGIIVKEGFFSIKALCMQVETGLGVAALICLGLESARNWLSYTVPSFTAKTFHY